MSWRFGFLRSITNCFQRAQSGARPVVGPYAQAMSTSRKRAQARFSSRRIDQELQGAQDALIAFEGYGTGGPMLHASALQRPAVRRSGAWFDKVFEQFHRLLAGFSHRG